jgi:hypothetical protein
LALDGSLGHVTEVLSGANYQSLSTSSPHQIWSAAMVVSPLLRGMFGLRSDATKGTLTFAPHPPADWTSFRVTNVPVGSAKLDLHYSKDAGEIKLEVKVTGDTSRTIEFQPAVSLRAKVLGVEFNGKPVPFHVDSNATDQHVITRVTVSGASNPLRIRIQNDFALSYSSTLPAIGETSQGLRILSELWTPARDRLTINASGLAGSQYKLSVWGAEQIAAVEGARISKAANGKTELILDLPKNGAEGTSYATISIQFAKRNNRQEPAKQ